MYNESLNLGLPEFAVVRAITELHEDHYYISAQKIADYISCDRRTVERAIGRLRKAGDLVRGDGSPTWGGYHYDVKR